MSSSEYRLPNNFTVTQNIRIRGCLANVRQPLKHTSLK